MSKQIRTKFCTKLKRVKVLLEELVNMPEMGERGFELTYFNPRGYKGTTLQKFNFYGKDCPQKFANAEVPENEAVDLVLEESSEGVENTSVVTVASQDLNTSNSLNSSQMSLDCTLSQGPNDALNSSQMSLDLSFSQGPDVGNYLEVADDANAQKEWAVDLGDGNIINCPVFDFGDDVIEDPEEGLEEQSNDIFHDVKFPEEIYVNPAILDQIRKFGVDTIEELPEISSLNDIKLLRITPFGRVVKLLLLENLGAYYKYKPLKFSLLLNETLRKLVPSFSLLYEESRGHIFINRDTKHRVRFMELDVRDSLMKSLCVPEKEKPKNHNMTPDDAEFIRKVCKELKKRPLWNKTNSVPHALKELNLFSIANCVRARRLLNVLQWRANPLQNNKPELNDSAREQRRHYAEWFGRELQKDQYFYRRILITDEMRMVFRSNKTGNRFVWAPSNAVIEPPSYGQKYFGGSIMVAAIVCYDYKGPLFFFVNDPGNNKTLKPFNLDKDVYINNLLPFWFDDLRNKGMIQGNKLVNGYLLQQDGAPAHTAKLSMEFLDENVGLENVISRTAKKLPPGDCREKIRAQWPANSPDISPLDYSIWNMFKRRAFDYLEKRDGMQYFRDARHCRDILEDTWENLITVQDINSIIDGMPRRVERMREARGGLVEGYRKANKGGLKKK